uniref:hypothetical protein n=1 Tax=Lachnobacterium bovis TaxID=140626 RepID=UPI0003B53109|nr:hypothetical protein [Lachnobacterium bovis]
MWPNPIKWVKDKTKKAAKAVGSAVNKAGKATLNFYEKHKTMIRDVGIVTLAAIGTAALAPVIGPGALLAVNIITGAAVGAGLDYLDQKDRGGKINKNEIIVQAVGGALFSVIPGAAGEFAGKAVGNVTKSIVKRTVCKYGTISASSAALGAGVTATQKVVTGDTKNMKEDCLGAATSNAVCGPIFYKASSMISNKFGGKIGKLKRGNDGLIEKNEENILDYDSKIERARNEKHNAQSHKDSEKAGKNIKRYENFKRCANKTINREKAIESKYNSMKKHLIRIDAFLETDVSGVGTIFSNVFSSYFGDILKCENHA